MAFVPTSLKRKRHVAPAAITKKEPEQAVAVAPPKKDDGKPEPTASPRVVAAETVIVVHQSITKSMKADEPDTLDADAARAERMRALHENVTDFYDPAVPNDLLAYREQQRNERRREELERSAKETLRLQQKMRERIQEERDRAQRTGDYDTIAEVRARTSLADNDGGVGSGSGGMGRGRGRGVSNLPAWLSKKQQERNGPRPPSLDVDGDDVAPTNDDDDALLLLTNLTAPGEPVDDELAGEVREECENCCGPVRSVELDDSDPGSAVQIFVRFENRDHARTAAKLFHGRSFAQRTVGARLVGQCGRESEEDGR